MDALVDWDDDLNQKPIHLAAQNDHTAVVKLFLQVRPSLVTSTVRDGNTLAHLAAKKGSVEVLRTMFEVDKLLVTNAVNRFTENTPLHLATEGGHLEAVKLMLLNGVAPNDENKFGQFTSIEWLFLHNIPIAGLTPVHLAAKCGHADVFDVFAKVRFSEMLISTCLTSLLPTGSRQFEAAELQDWYDGSPHRGLLRGGGDRQGTV